MDFAKIPVMAGPAKFAAQVSKMSDGDLRRMGIDEIIKLLRQTDSEKLKAIVDKGNMMKDINHRMQSHLVEIREFKDVNQKLQDDNQELRDLCCFLDDDRQKGRKLAKEWQRFGRYTSSVMKSEVAAYQEKLKELEKQQEELIKENLELKELCIYLDQDLKRYTNGDSLDRDQGDGSSNSSTGAGEKGEEPAPRTMEDIVRSRPITDDRAVLYIRKLEDKISQLEQDKIHLSQSQRTERTNSDNLTSTSDPRKYFSSPHLESLGTKGYDPLSKKQSSLTGKPEAVAQAMKVLEVHEQLEMPQVAEQQQGEGDMDDMEKALIRQMCNVVWKKLGEDVPGYNNAARF